MNSYSYQEGQNSYSNQYVPLSDAELEHIVDIYRQKKHEAEDIKKEVQYYRDIIEAEMIQRGAEELKLGSNKISYKLVSTTSVDSKTLERDFNDVWRQVTFVKQAARLTIS